MEVKSSSVPRNPDTQEAAWQSTKRSLALYRHPPPRGRLRSGGSRLRAKQISDCLETPNVGERHLDNVFIFTALITKIALHIVGRLIVMALVVL